MIEAFRSSISFLTTIPLGGDVESLRKNLWVFPFTAILIGSVVAIPGFFNAGFLAIVFYVAIEGVNHIDGLADFGDALFAPKDRKKRALKDLNTGAGGITVVLVYLILLHEFLSKSNFWEILFSQIAAKFAMVLLMFVSKPAWEGLGAFMMEKVSAKDILLGFIPLALFGLKVWPESVLSILSLIFVVIFLKKYSEKHFGGINGDVIGSANCLTFVSSLILSNQL